MLRTVPLNLKGYTEQYPHIFGDEKNTFDDLIWSCDINSDAGNVAFSLWRTGVCVFVCVCVCAEGRDSLWPWRGWRGPMPCCSGRPGADNNNTHLVNATNHTIQRGGGGGGTREP